MRTFIAIDPTDDVRARLYRATEPLRAADLPVRWVAEESLHLTLQFLGEVKDDRREDLIRTVAGVAGRFDPFELRVGGLGAFPSARRPRVIWAGIEPAPVLLDLQKAIETGLAGLGFEPERRSYHPHITLGRVRARGSHPAFERLSDRFDEIEIDERFRVASVDVMKSTLSPRGARYEVVRALEL